MLQVGTSADPFAARLPAVSQIVLRGSTLLIGYLLEFQKQPIFVDLTLCCSVCLLNKSDGFVKPETSNISGKSKT